MDQSQIQWLFNHESHEINVVNHESQSKNTNHIIQIIYRVFFLPGHFYFPTGYYFQHSILEGFLGWHFCQGYRKLVPASDCVREERELVCLHIVLGDNIGLLVLASEGSCGLTDVVRYIDRYIVIYDLVEHGESGNTTSLLKCWPIQSLSSLSH